MNTKAKELEERESRIDRTMQSSYYEIGLDLKEIKGKKLYKEERLIPVAGHYSFTTWDEYVETRFPFDKRRADRKILYAEAALKMGQNCPILPTTESHMGTLLRLESDKDRVIVWKNVVDEGVTITAGVINEEIEKFNAAKEKNWLTLDEWKESEEKPLFARSNKVFNKQEGASIEWAQWSWNPVTGCKHPCPYCYARDIAKRFYPQEFEPSIYPERMAMPENTKVPANAENNTAFKNVFTCSMADLFGRWVPDEWINAVFETVANSPQWNFLFLTKFPKRMVEFDYPDNAWLGTSVDCQDRVKAAEDAFENVTSGTKWLSVEPMLEPLMFARLHLFDWIVIGGASRSSGAPEWVPPIDWLIDLHVQARKANCKIYYKDNTKLPDELRIREFPWEEPTERALPVEFKYLNIK